MTSDNNPALPANLSLVQIRAELHALKEEFLRIDESDATRAMDIAIRFGELVVLKKRFETSHIDEM